MISTFRKIHPSRRNPTIQPASRVKTPPSFPPQASQTVVAQLLLPEDHHLMKLVFDDDERYRRFTMQRRCVQDEIQAQLILGKTDTADLADQEPTDEFAKQTAKSMTQRECEITLHTIYEFVGRQQEAVNRENTKP